MRSHILKALRNNLTRTTLSAVFLLGITTLRAEVIAEWKFGTLPAGPVSEVPDSATGGFALRQEALEFQPVAASLDREGENLTAAEFHSAKRQFLKTSGDAVGNFGENTSFTIEVGLQIYSFPETAGTARQIIMKRSRTGHLHGWSLAVTPEGRAVFVIAGEVEPPKVIYSKNPLPLSRWVSLAATRAEDGRMELFLDGSSVARGAGTPASLANESDLFVGKHSGAENRSFYFDGAIAGIRIATDSFAVDPEAVFAK